MSDTAKKIVVGLLVAVVFCVCIALVIVGHSNIGLQGLITELVGLEGFVFLLWLYNRQFR